MPRLDGLEATRQIRRQATAQPRIIAMTAASSQAEEDVCFEAGMDAYLRKPVAVEDLRAVLLKASPDSTVPPPAKPDTYATVDFSIVDRLYALRPEVVLELVHTFLTSGAERVARLGEALAAGDADGLRAVAHSLKGSASTLGAGPLAELCKRLEKQPMAEAGEVLEALGREFERVGTAFRKHLRKWEGAFSPETPGTD